MSYSILYNRCFIKISDHEVIPMIQAGDNNCYDVIGKARSRSWFNHTYYCPNHVFATQEAILKKIDEELERQVAGRDTTTTTPEEISKNFGSCIGATINGSWPTYTRYRSYYQNACKQAMTIEELATYGVHVIVISLNDNLTEKEITPISSTEHLWAVLTQLLLSCGDFQKVNVEFSDDWDVDQMIKRRNFEKRSRRTVRYEFKDFTTYYQLYYIENGGYFIKNTRNGFKYSHYSGKKFATEKEAISFQKRMRNKDLFKIKECTGQVRIKVRVKPAKQTNQLSIVS